MSTIKSYLQTTAPSTVSDNPYQPSTEENVVTNANPPQRSSSIFAIGEDPATASWLTGLAQTTIHEVILYNSAEVFLNSYDGSKIGCVVCDVRLPGMSGLELLKRLTERSWDIPVVMMSASADVPTAVQALKSGAIDFVEKTPSEPLMLDLILHAISLHTQRIIRRAEWKNLQAQLGLLTPRELEVMQLVVAGQPNKTIAVDLGVSTKTVEAHRAHVMKKMAVRSLPDLVRMAIRAGELQRGFARESRYDVQAHLH